MLFEEFMVPVKKMTRTLTADGHGGQTTVWTEGDQFNAAIVKAVKAVDTEAVIAAHQDDIRRVTITFPVDVTLNYHDVIKRVSDGVCYRVTSDGAYTEPPARSTFKFRQVSAEEWSLP